MYNVRAIIWMEKDIYWVDNILKEKLYYDFKALLADRNINAH